jgi:Flp pilus assembly protein TadB
LLYESLCNVSSKIPLFSKLGAYNKDKELEKAVKFLTPLMNVTAQGVVSAAFLMTLISFLGVSVFLHMLGMNPFISIPLGAITGVLVYYSILTFPINKMSSYKLSLSEESDLIFEQFILVFQSGGTIFDAIEMVAKSNHPYLSLAFQQMLARINQGIPPERCILEFTQAQPSDDLRRYFTAIISSLEQKTDLLDMLSGESFEADLTLRQKNLELESRLLIVAALSTYMPIMVTLSIALSGYATNLATLLIAPFFILLNSFLKSRFTSHFVTYFDKPQENGILTPSQSEIIAEYDEFLNFLILLSEKLRMGDTLEVALPAIRDQIGPSIQHLVDIAIESIYWKNRSLAEAINAASKRALGQRVSNILNLIVLMCEVSSVEAGERLTRIAGRLVKRSVVAKERDSIIAAQKLKVYILSFTSAVVLGLMTSLSPFLYIGSLLSDGFTWSPNQFKLIDIAPLLVALLVITFSTGYQNTKMVGGSRFKMIGLICAMLFCISLIFSALILDLSIL